MLSSSRVRPVEEFGRLLVSTLHPPPKSTFLCFGNRPIAVALGRRNASATNGRASPPNSLFYVSGIVQSLLLPLGATPPQRMQPPPPKSTFLRFGNRQIAFALGGRNAFAMNGRASVFCFVVPLAGLFRYSQLSAGRGGRMIVPGGRGSGWQSSHGSE